MENVYRSLTRNHVVAKAAPFWKRHFWLVSITALFLLSAAFPANASHFRGGTVTWTRVSSDATTITIRLNVSLSWRNTAAPSFVDFLASGGNTGFVRIPLTNSLDATGLWTNSVGTGTIRLNKTSTLTTLAFTGCCKISTLANNRDLPWNVFTVLNTAADGSSPVSTMPAIINMPVNASPAVFNIPASDPDAGSTLTYRLATTTEMAGGTNPAGLTIDPTSGQLRFNTVGKTVGQQYNAMVVVTDNDGNQLLLDFMINITGPSTPPAFDYSVTPVNGFLYNVIAGQEISFPIRATDSDAGSFVDLSVSGLPSYITLANFSNAPLPARGNPAATTFAWTPSAAQVGNTVVLNFIATDNVGVQASTSITIRVAAEPPPLFVGLSPLEGSIRQIMTGVEHVDKIEASSSLGSNVSIGFATVPLGAILSPTVPTPGANPGKVTLSWTPAPSDFGEHALSFQALIASAPTIFSTLSYKLIVNTKPVFRPVPALSVDAGEPFSYLVIVDDPDMNFGDQVDIIARTLPSWLTLTRTGNGSALLSGTPAFANGGLNPVHLEAEDTYHHGYPELAAQIFSINVVTCTDPVLTCPADIVAGTDAGKCSASVAFGAEVTGDPDPSVMYTIGQGQIISSGYEFPVGVTTVTVTATNICKVTTCTFNVTVSDTEKPVITASPDVSTTSDPGKCDALITVSASASDNCSTVDAVGVRSDGLALNAPYAVGITTIEWNTQDEAGNAAETVVQRVNVTDSEAPIIAHNGNPVVMTDNGACSAQVYVAATATDNCGAGTPTGVRSDGLELDAPFPLGMTTITWNVTDIHDNPAKEVVQTVTVENAAPVITSVTASGTVLSINTPVTLAVAFDDNNVAGARFDWDDQSYDEISPGAADNVSATHAYASPGVYSVKVTLTDACGMQAEYIYRYLIVYDVNGGFVTGGGWIHSPAGAFSADPALAGKAHFGFVAKYKEGATVPDGNLEFQFHPAGLGFHSTSYEWLVIAGHKAQLKGVGTINGSGTYTLLITGIDGGQGRASGPDEFRIKIMDGSTVIYDNKMGAADDGDEATVLGGGSIVIHNGKAKASASARMTGGISLAETSPETKSVVFPNPVEDVLYFSYESTAKAPVAAQLVDLQGKRVKQQIYEVSADKAYSMDIGHLNLRAGVYLLTLRQGASTRFLRVIKK